MALCWFHEMKWIESVPLPPDDRRFLEPKPDKKNPEKLGTTQSKPETKTNTKGKGKTKSKSKSKEAAENADTTMKADGTGQTPIGEPDAVDVLAIMEPPETAENAITEPNPTNYTGSTDRDGQDGDTDEKSRLL